MHVTLGWIAFALVAFGYGVWVVWRCEGERRV